MISEDNLNNGKKNRRPRTESHIPLSREEFLEQAEERLAERLRKQREQQETLQR
jgi:hypothetical protein